MYRKFELSNTYTLPNGKTFTGEDLKMNPEYSGVIDDNTVVDVVGGILTSFDNILKLSEIYGVDDLDIDAAVSQINAIKATIAKNKIAVQMSADSILKAAKLSALSFTDEQAIEVADLYPEYEVDHAYKQNDRFQYNGSLYKVNQNHTSQAQWVPGEVGTESLYTNLMLNDAGYQIWKQPTGAHDAYNTGDIVEYKGTLYKSLINGNAWAPDVYPAGWQEYDESTPTEPGTPDPGTETPTEPDYPDFVQPTGAHDAYKKGDIVRYNGKLYQSLIDANAYSPDAYPQGWEVYTEE